MYRDDYAALQAKADATQRNLEELRASTTQDKDKIAALEKELVAATKALKIAHQRLGLTPKKSKALPVLLLASLSIAGFVAYLNFMKKRTQAEMEEMKAQASLKEMSEYIKWQVKPEDPICTPQKQGLEGATALPFLKIEPPKDCRTRNALEENWKPLLVIRNEEEFQESYLCPDSEGKDQKNPSGLDFQHFQLIVLSTMESPVEVAFAVKNQDQVFLGVRPISQPMYDLPHPNGLGTETRSYLIPAGSEPIQTKECFR